MNISFTYLKRAHLRYDFSCSIIVLLDKPSTISDEPFFYFISSAVAIFYPSVSLPLIFVYFMIYWASCWLWAVCRFVLDWSVLPILSSCFAVPPLVTLPTSNFCAGLVFLMDGSGGTSI